MRNLASVRKWSVCLIATASVSCSQAAQNEVADGNAAANVESASDVENVADANAAGASVDGNTASGSAEETYRASGTEPFWSLTIGGGQMAYDSADGPDVTVATPPMQPTRAGYRYATPEMTVAVNTFIRCESANGQTYHDTVRVTVGGQTVEGCGGEATPG